MEAKPVRLVKFITAEGYGPYSVVISNKLIHFKYDLIDWNIIERKFSKNGNQYPVVKVCKRGLHASTYDGIHYWFHDYEERNKDIRAFIVEVSGHVDLSHVMINDKIAAEKMKFIHEIDLSECVTYGDKLILVRQEAEKYNVFRTEEYQLASTLNPYFKKFNHLDHRQVTRI